MAKRPGWSSIDAVAKHHVFTLNDDIASRWGPRIDGGRVVSTGEPAQVRTAPRLAAH
ncbi:MAG: hypothetical protein ACRDRL_16255 [Sciscionella sp.]